MKRLTVHRSDTGRNYQGRPIHAAPGVHEHAASLCKRSLPEGSHILEVGAGSGALAKRLEDIGFNVIATDLDPVQPWIQQLDLDNTAASPPLAHKYDMVLCIETMEHLENPRAALRSMRSLMAVGSTILISTPNVTQPHSRLKFLRTGVPILFGSDAYYDTGHITLLPDWLLIEHLRSCGFDKVTIERAGELGIGSRLRRVAHRLEMVMLRTVGVQQAVSAGDGACLFVVATAV